MCLTCGGTFLSFWRSLWTMQCLYNLSAIYASIFKCKYAHFFSKPKEKIFLKYLNTNYFPHAHLEILYAIGQPSFKIWQFTTSWPGTRENVCIISRMVIQLGANNTRRNRFNKSDKAQLFLVFLYQLRGRWYMGRRASDGFFLMDRSLIQGQPLWKGVQNQLGWFTPECWWIWIFYYVICCSVET